MLIIKTICLSVYLFILNVINYIIRELSPTIANMDHNKEIPLRGDNQLSFNISLMARQRQHHKKSFEFISEALKLDEEINDSRIGLYFY